MSHPLFGKILARNELTRTDPFVLKLVSNLVLLPRDNTIIIIVG